MTRPVAISVVPPSSFLLAAVTAPLFDARDGEVVALNTSFLGLRSSGLLPEIAK